MARNDARGAKLRKDQDRPEQNRGYDEAVRGGVRTPDLDVRDEWLDNQPEPREEDIAPDRQSER